MIEPDERVHDVVLNALLVVPGLPKASYPMRAAGAITHALADLELCRARFPEARKGVAGWWDRARCVKTLVLAPAGEPTTVREHVWLPEGFADWRCPRCGQWR